MPKARSKPYKRGDRFVVYIPEDIDEETLKYINSPKFLSPKVIELLVEKSKESYTDNEKKKESKELR
jgi:hypothetical protein